MTSKINGFEFYEVRSFVSCITDEESRRVIEEASDALAEEYGQIPILVGGRCCFHDYESTASAILSNHFRAPEAVSDCFERTSYKWRKATCKVLWGSARRTPSLDEMAPNSPAYRRPILLPRLCELFESLALIRAAQSPPDRLATGRRKVLLALLRFGRFVDLVSPLACRDLPRDLNSLLARCIENAILVANGGNPFAGMMFQIWNAIDYPAQTTAHDRAAAHAFVRDVLKFS